MWSAVSSAGQMGRMRIRVQVRSDHPRLPFLHISFKYTASRRRVPAKRFIAIGQFAYGVITISQFGIGVFSLSQFTIAGFAVAQMAVAYSLLAQFGVFLHRGRGQLVWGLADLLRRLF